MLSYRQARGAAVSYTTRKGVSKVPVTLTFHVFGYTVTVRVKKQNRHPAR